MATVDVRSIRIPDMFRFPSMTCETAALEQDPPSVVQRLADLRMFVPFSRRDRAIFVAVNEGTPVAFAELTIDDANHRWVLSRVAMIERPETEKYQSSDAAGSELIAHAIRSAGAARAARIHAAFLEGSEVNHTLLDCGFSPYARDSILLARRLPSGSTEEGRTRRQERSDTWSIHQLYNLVTPRPIQYAEALTSNHWEIEQPGKANMRGFVIDQGFETGGYCRVISARSRTILQPMVAPERLDLLEPLILAVVNELGSARHKPLLVLVPDYLQEYLDRVQRMGFEPVDHQLRMVKYTVVSRKLELRAIEELVHEIPERAVAGTPTFYNSGNGQAGFLGDPRETGQITRVE